MQTLKLSDEQARNFYPSAAPELKAILESSFGEKFFQQKITVRVTSFEDACRIAGVVSSDVFPYDENHPFGALNSEQKAIYAFAKLSLIRKVLNEGWEPDWDNNSQYKWYPWFKKGSASFSFNNSNNFFNERDTINSRLRCLH